MPLSGTGARLARRNGWGESFAKVAREKVRGVEAILAPILVSATSLVFYMDIELRQPMGE
jgi:hypothetical protein